MKKEEQNIKVMWIISAVFLIIAGILAILFPIQAIESLTFLLALLMLISGIIQTLTFLLWKDYVRTTNWLLADGLLTIALAIIIMIIPNLTLAFLPYVLCCWLLFSGITKISSAFELKEIGIDDWKWAVALGSMEAIFGIVVFACPNLTAVIIGFFTGAIFLIKGISIFTTGIMIKDLFKHPKSK